MSKSKLESFTIIDISLRCKPPFDYWAKSANETVENHLQEGTLEFYINNIFNDEIDMTDFDDKYSNDDIGSPAYDPKINADLFTWQNIKEHRHKVTYATN